MLISRLRTEPTYTLGLTFLSLKALGGRVLPGSEGVCGFPVGCSWPGHGGEMRGKEYGDLSGWREAR